jgi:non-heme chloroperoxidase
MMASHKATHDCIKAFSETDITEDLGALRYPDAIVQWDDDDEIVPIAAAGEASAKLVKGSTRAEANLGSIHRIA